eukprot:m.14118 g.14118  ORF g.14118 m.14118 type:complete len:498 (+) comp4256_c0_seq1:147-1640(+)
MMNGDGMDDLADVMGDDFGFGYDDDIGDPNVRPKRPLPPKVVDGSLTHDEAVVVFPEQQQFLELLKVQVVAVSSPNQANPFENFALDSFNREYKCEHDPKTATQMRLDGLVSGTMYAARLVVANPSGSAVSPASRVFVTLPKSPSAPEVVDAQTDSINFKFPAQEQLLTKLVIQVVLEEFGFEGDESQVISFEVNKPPKATTYKCEGLACGTAYRARLVVTNETGSAVGQVSSQALTVPNASDLKEDITKRSSNTVGFSFSEHQQFLTRLVLEYSGKKNRQTKTLNIDKPREATFVLVDGLDASETYSFKLIATNKSGSTTGTTIKITTVEAMPELNDMSGWMSEVPQNSGKKTLGRRLSMRKQKPKRFFFVVDGKLLTWFDEPHGEEVGFVHLGKVKDIVHDPPSSLFELHIKGQPTVMYNVESPNPNVSADDLCDKWVNVLREATSKKHSSMSTSSTNSVSILPSPKPSEPVAVEKQPIPLEEVEDDMEDDEFGF